MRHLLILNDQTYGTERSGNASRLARGITDTEVSADCKRSSMGELAAWTAWSDKVIVF